jgi:hypothetical protein
LKVGLVHHSLSIGDFFEYLSLGLNAAKVGGLSRAANGKTGAFSVPRFFCLMRPVTGIQGYSLFTVAVAKIPLSMVPVNRKPQHLVFRCGIQHPAAKSRESGCGKREEVGRMRSFALQFAQNTVQMRLPRLYSR